MAKEKIQPVRGMQDILPKEMRRHRKVTETAREVARLYGFEHMATPIMESVEVFKRTLGETSDVVNKEMYVLNDRKDKELVLRPENTASIVRAFISNGLQQSLPAKFFYSGPMFRYERPQAGRQRQFHQIGVELLGANDILADADVITCGYQILDQLGLIDRVTLQINTLGDAESRANYQKELVEYLTKYEKDLSTDSQKRLKKNPMRILDSKDDNDRKIILGAPRSWDYLNRESAERLSNTEIFLKAVGIKYHLNSYLVRGLDYYCHTVFEFVTDDLGAQGAVLAGGRYDGLVKALGGNDIAGVGWAAGVERLALMLDEAEADAPQISLVPYNPKVRHIDELAYWLRRHGIRTDYLYFGALKKHMQHANNVKAQFTLLAHEFEKPTTISAYQLKDMGSGIEYAFPFSAGTPEELKKIDWLPKLAELLKEFHKQ